MAPVVGRDRAAGRAIEPWLTGSCWFCMLATLLSRSVSCWAALAAIMTLAVTSRASLGHTGQPLVASPAPQAIYAAAATAAVARTWAALHPKWSGPFLHLATVAWAAAFLGFAALFAPLLCRSKRVPIRSLR
jgi:uncharacterized protein involved in response to NO